MLKNTERPVGALITALMIHGASPAPSWPRVHCAAWGDPLGLRMVHVPLFGVAETSTPERKPGAMSGWNASVLDRPVAGSLPALVTVTVTSAVCPTITAGGGAGGPGCAEAAARRRTETPF